MTLPPLPKGQKMGSAVINGKYFELLMHDDEAMRAYAEAAVLAERATQADALHVAYSQGVADGRDAERERVAAWLDEQHQKRKHFDNHAAFYAAAIRALDATP